MSEQQYTCPFCHKDYTKFTIHEHYGCGVEPLEAIAKPIEYHPHKITLTVPPVDLQESGFSLPTEQESPQFTAEEIEKVKTEQAKPLEVNKIEKPEPKKRGPKPKVKTVA